MRSPVKLALFAALLAVALVGGVALGGALDPDARGSDPGEAAGPSPDGHAMTDGAAPRGLAAVNGGLRMVPGVTELRRGRAQRYRFRILDEEDRPVQDFDLEHEQRMHLITVRRDLTGYRHLHPRPLPDGSWEVGLELDEPGTHRVYADFVRAGVAHTLAVDLSVPGRYHPRPPAHPSRQATAPGGYDVRLDEGGGEFRFGVSRNGRPVHDLEPYLGARGHLVALRESDLAYLHVHPEDDATAGREIRFAVRYPSAGRYGLFLQFRHEGRVRTVAFTRQNGDREEVGDVHGH